MDTKERLVKCYKYKINFKIWETLYDDGACYVTGCPHAVSYGNDVRPRCNGLDSYGYPCHYANDRKFDPPDASKPSE